MIVSFNENTFCDDLIKRETLEVVEDYEANTNNKYKQYRYLLVLTTGAAE
jgi:hypothetical protein